MSFCPQDLNFFLQVILCCIITVAHQQPMDIHQFFLPKYLREVSMRLTAYQETTGLHGIAYAASRGSEKYSSDFGWSAAVAEEVKYISKRGTTTSNHFCKSRLMKIHFVTWPGRCVSQNTHAITPSAKIWADSVPKKPLEMLIQCIIPLIAPMFNTKAILNYSIRYLNTLLSRRWDLQRWENEISITCHQPFQII